MFVTVMCLVLRMCVLMALGMFVSESYVVLDECDEPPYVLWCSEVFITDALDHNALTWLYFISIC